MASPNLEYGSLVEAALSRDDIAWSSFAALQGLAFVGSDELRRELHSKNKEIEHIEAELKQSKSQQIRAMAKLSVQKSKAEKQLTQMKAQLGKLGEDKGALFKEVGSLEAQLAQAHADASESRNWASTYRDMLLRVT